MTERIALYWHNGRSLGHTIRSATLGQGLLERMPGSAVIGITGASKGIELLPPGMDVLKLPSYLAFDHPQGAASAPILPLTRDELTGMRANLIATFLRDLRPRALLVDYYPQGNDGELVQAIMHSPATQKVLGLRGILGMPEQTNRQFFSPRMADFIRANYAAIHVYVDEHVFRLEEYYDVPAALVEMLRYTGYVTRPAAASRQEARAQLKLDAQARVVVASFGGGQGTESLWRAVLHGLERIESSFDAAYFAAGPYLEAGAYARLQNAVAPHPNWHWMRLLDPLPVWMQASDLFIGSGGYNSLSEVLATRANALIIPRQLNEREQLLHATSLAKLQALRLLDLETAQSEDIASVLEMCLREPFPVAGQLLVRTDGAVTNARLIEELLSQIDEPGNVGGAVQMVDPCNRPETQRMRSNPLSEFTEDFMDGIQEQQVVNLTDEFLRELMQELDRPDIIGITLGGSYARGTATRFSDVDLACFWREGVKPPPKRFLYRQDKLISIKMTSVAEIRETLKRPDSAMLAISGKRRLLLDKDGSVARLLAEIEAFRWEDLQEAVNAHVSQWMMLMAEDIQKVLREFEQENAPGLTYVITKLVGVLTYLTALCQRTLISSDSTYYQQVQEAAGLDSAWTHFHLITTGLEAGPTGIVPLRARGIAALHLYRETLAFARPVMQAEHRAIAEQVWRVVQLAAEQLPFTEEEQQWLKNWRSIEQYPTSSYRHDHNR